MAACCGMLGRSTAATQASTSGREDTPASCGQRRQQWPRLQHASSRKFLGSASCLSRSGHSRVRTPRALKVEAVIPQLQGDATEQTPPDLPSYIFKERIVYLGMSLVPAVTELVLAELLYLQYDNPTRPVYMYINSAGVTKGGDKLGYEAEAFAIYDTMRYIKPSVRTLCVGNAFGESAMLLAAGEQGQRGALPSSTIMLRQPMQRFAQMQASDIDIYRNEIRKTKNEMVRLLAKHTDHTAEEIEKEVSRPKYYDPYEAVDFGIIDKVLEPEEASKVQMIRK